MNSKCRCGHLAKGQFRGGWYHFNHCGRSWRVEARQHGSAQHDHTGTALGAVVGTVGALASAVNPLGGLFVGALMGCALNGSNGRPCPHCSRHATAYPTGRLGKQGDRQYQCSDNLCKRFSFGSKR